jgi:hypothetical protein
MTAESNDAIVLSPPDTMTGLVSVTAGDVSVAVASVVSVGSSMMRSLGSPREEVGETDGEAEEAGVDSEIGEVDGEGESEGEVEDTETEVVREMVGVTVVVMVEVDSVRVTVCSLDRVWWRVTVCDLE